jgi:signal transduction histidine kinase/CheY-like chemotaxis protein
VPVRDGVQPRRQAVDTRNHAADVPAPQRRRLAARALPAFVLAVLAVASVTAYGFATRVVDEQERRLLDQRAVEVEAVLTNLVGALQSSLRVLGTVGAAGSDAAPSLFAEAAAPLVAGPTAAVGVAVDEGPSMRVVAAAGDAPAVGTLLDGVRDALGRRALARRALVADLVVTGDARRIVLAMPAGPPGAVAYAETRVDPTTPVASAPSSPFRDVAVAVYAGPDADPARLVLTTERDVPLAGDVERREVAIGADRWLLAVRARSPLVGSLAHDLPWILLGFGLTAAVLVAVIVATLARRRAYALALVARRTEELQRAFAELRDAREAAEEANRSKSEFLSRMSHELRTPLNAVLGFAQLLELGSLTPEQRESVGQILKAGRHLLDLINEVLDIARIEAGRLVLSPEAVAVRDLVDETVELVRPIADQQGVQVVAADARAADGYVFADRQRAKQVLLNLLSNGVKYNRPRGTVAVTCADTGRSRLRLCVSDTGVGIPAERLGLLFTPFERLGAEQTAVEGTGIGLALSQRLAQAMGGVVGVESELGKGSTFWLELPQVEGPVERFERLDRVDSAPAPRSRARETVLYVEDNVSNLRLIERVVQVRGDVEVVAAMQGRLGLELAREHRPALVLLDLHLPDMPGEEVLRRLREDPATASTPVVIVSADATPGHVQRLLTAGASAYVTKPVDVRDLLAVLDDLLGEAGGSGDARE